MYIKQFNFSSTLATPQNDTSSIFGTEYLKAFKRIHGNRSAHVLVQWKIPSENDSVEDSDNREWKNAAANVQIKMSSCLIN